MSGESTITLKAACEAMEVANTPLFLVKKLRGSRSSRAKQELQWHAASRKSAHRRIGFR